MRLFGRRTWNETLYLLLDLPVGVLGFTVVTAGLAAGVGLLVTFLGVPLLAGTLLLARLAARAELARARALLGIRVQPPGSMARRDTLLGRLLAPFRDGAAWRAT